jgi:hypothetical protein
MTLTTDINDGRPWFAMDNDDLCNEVASGASLETAATFLCRTPDEVAIRAALLGLRWQEALH